MSAVRPVSAVIGKCRACGAAKSARVVDGIAVGGRKHGKTFWFTCACGGLAILSPVRFLGRGAATKCNGSCCAGKGPVCNCECGGDNHGSAHAVTS